MEKEKSPLQQIDYGLLLILFLLMLVSLVAIYSATASEHGYFFVKRQIMWYMISSLVIIPILLIDYRRLRELATPFYGIGIVLLLLVYFFGDVKYGAKRWISLSESVDLQPSEFMKIFLIIIIAHLLVKWQENQAAFTLKDDFWLSAKIGLITIVPFLMILKQPDLGTALVILGIITVLLLVSGISWRLLALYALLGSGFIAFLVFLYFVNFDLFSIFIKGHQLNRILGWLNPQEFASGESYQLVQATLAIGSGQLFGRGFREGIQAQGGWIPEVHTDFIFAIIGEEFGFIGASILISLYFIFVYRLVHIALSCNDMFGTYLVAGVISLIIFQVFQNIGMTIGLAPVTGIALPFISYGGSSLLSNMIALGIVLNVAMRTKAYMFN